MTLGVLAVAISARVAVTIPGTSVPQSAQTLAVLLVGALLGARNGALTLAAYLLAGGVGVPVFADGAAGWSHLVGPTAGYLLGFLLAAAVVGWFHDHGVLRRFGHALALMIGGHALILLLGWARLAFALGGLGAFVQGVAPFAVGGFVKSVLAAGTVALMGAYRGRGTAGSPL